jgi:cell division septum initiation protein DivIVA
MIQPDEIDPTKLPVAFRGYDRAATDDLLKRVAWDYRQATRVQVTWTEERERLKQRITELEAQVTSQQVEFARALSDHDATSDAASHSRVSKLEAEVARLERLVRQHERRRDLTQTLLETAQRSARDLRESARQDAEAVLKAAQRRAVEIQREARTSLRHSSTEIDRLQRLESDLRDRLRRTLESVIKPDEQRERTDEAQEPGHEDAANPVD